MIIFATFDLTQSFGNCGVHEKWKNGRCVPGIRCRYDYGWQKVVCVDLSEQARRNSFSGRCVTTEDLEFTIGEINAERK